MTAPGKVASVTVLVTIGVLLLGAAFFLLDARQPAPEPLVIPTHTLLPPPTHTPVPPTATMIPTVAPIGVHVTGEVHAPGVYLLPAGSRVIDAVQAAGGAKDSADLVMINLAAYLTDGQQVYVPAIVPGVTSVPQGQADPPSGSAPAARPTSTPAFPVRINQASQAELEAIPGIGPVTAEAIIAFRNARGRINDPSELLDVRGIGDRTLALILPYLSFE